jgi:5-methylcytosine-specific restriction endonuclease McrBC GTP-binding regulatory subunit McrB
MNNRGAHYNVIAPIYNFMHSAAFPKQAPTTVMPDKGEVVQSYLRQGEASGWQLRADKAYPPFVLVLDEINRGNISRIFGELITLIEDDKRHDRENALMVTLPSSRELFTVPPNLILLGTMNTADKSLALLDVALRRRFEFSELPPRFDLCTGLPGLAQVMDRINERIHLRKDRDHRIGHAFFMGVTTAAQFNQVFLRKVVPLLQEYFFGDDEGLRFVLGESNSDAVFLRELRVEGADARHQRTRWQWFTEEESELEAWSVLNSRFGSNAEAL